MVKSAPKIEYVEPSQVYTSNYLKNSKAVGVLWGVFTFCFAIIDVVVFIQPQWIGDSVESKGTGYFGLWKHCSLVQGGQEIVCKGQLEDFSTILNPAFRAATIFVGLSVILVLVCLCAMLFFFFFSSSTVFHICGWLQVFSGEFICFSHWSNSESLPQVSLKEAVTPRCFLSHQLTPFPQRSDISLLLSLRGMTFWSVNCHFIFFTIQAPFWSSACWLFRLVGTTHPCKKYADRHHAIFIRDNAAYAGPIY